MDLATLAENTGSNTPSQDTADLDEMVANPAHYAQELERLLDDQDCLAPEDRGYSEADLEDAHWALVEIMRSNTQSQDDNDDDERTPTVTEQNELKRPSEAGWVSYNDDPWTTYGDMAKKHAADLAAELYEFTTQAGTGWWGELTPSGFGPTTLQPFKSARKDCVDFADDAVVTTHVQAADESLVRREAGFRWDESSRYRVKVRGQYRDYLAAAGVFPVATDDDDEPTYGDDDMFVDGVLNDDAWEQQLVAEGLGVLA